MAQYILRDAKIWVAEFDLSGDHNQVTLANSVPELDRTTFGNGSRRRLAGLETTELTASGFSDFADDDVNEALHGRIGATAKPISVAPVDGADGGVAYTFQSLHFDYRDGGNVGEIANFEATARSKSKLIKGTVLEPGSAARGSSFNGTAREIGAVSATQKVYAALHVFAASGGTPTLDVVVQSDTASNFPSPANQITFTQATAKTSEWKTANGAITDTWWRIAVTIAGTGPSFTFAVVVGIK